MSLVGFVEQSLLVIFLSRNFTKAPADPSYPCVVGRKNDGEGFKRFVFRMMCLKNVFCFQLAKNGGINIYIYQITDLHKLYLLSINQKNILLHPSTYELWDGGQFYRSSFRMGKSLTWLTPLFSLHLRMLRKRKQDGQDDK